MEINFYNELKIIHDDLAYIKFDGIEIFLVFDDGSQMSAVEFVSGTRTRQIMDEIEFLLYGDD
jgi:hypothetical protein